jgi:hypothetical protein
LPFIKALADFTTLFVFSPQAGNTPYADLISSSNYASTVLIFLPGQNYDIRFLPRRSEVAVNLLSDVDGGEMCMRQAAQLIDARSPKSMTAGSHRPRRPKRASTR